MLRKRKSLMQIQKEYLEDEIVKTKNKIDCAYSNFSYALDTDLIDWSIYELNAANLKYKYLLKQAKLLYGMPPEEVINLFPEAIELNTGAASLHAQG